MDNSTTSMGHLNCAASVMSWYIFLSWFIIYLLMLPLFLFVLYIGFNKWKKPQSSSSGGLSHYDVITLNMVTMEITGVVGSCVSCYGFMKLNSAIISFGGDTVVSTMTGQTLFHSLTCVERYLAVVHPVVYLRLKRGGGVTIRNISILFVWVFCVTFTLLIQYVKSELFYFSTAFVLSFPQFAFDIYCSIYVLCVLIRPKPGERGGLKKIDQSKLSTVYTMVGILVVLLLRLTSTVTYNFLALFPDLNANGCVTIISSLWTSLPSSLLLPLLFLHRAGKLS